MYSACRNTLKNLFILKYKVDFQCFSIALDAYIKIELFTKRLLETSRKCLQIFLVHNFFCTPTLETNLDFLLTSRLTLKQNKIFPRALQLQVLCPSFKSEFASIPLNNFPHFLRSWLYKDSDDNSVFGCLLGNEKAFG